MAWTPRLATIRTQKVADNLLAYVIDEVRQVEAYGWAGDATIKPIKTVFSSTIFRDRPIYPLIAFSDDDDAQDLSNEIIDGTYRVMFVVQITNSNAETVVSQARIYRDALVSMIVNCPTLTLIANTGASSGEVVTIETGFDEIKHADMKEFMQGFQIRVGVILRAGFLA